jgi:hypothetical protein
MAAVTLVDNIIETTKAPVNPKIVKNDIMTEPIEKNFHADPRPLQVAAKPAHRIARKEKPRAARRQRKVTGLTMKGILSIKSSRLKFRLDGKFTDGLNDTWAVMMSLMLFG